MLSMIISIEKWVIFGPPRLTFKYSENTLECVRNMSPRTWWHGLRSEFNNVKTPLLRESGNS